MAKPLIQFLAQSEKYCCQWAYLNQAKYRDMTAAELSEVLGVSKRTIREVRGMFRDGLGCLKRENCRKEEIEKAAAKKR